ncbi:DUF3466 family protein [Colwellia sp. RE-S-Sl-9]
MKIFAKRILALGIYSALTSASVQAATYEVIDKGAGETHKYTFAQQENNAGEMVISGTQAYSFAVQYQFLNETDFDNIISNAALNHEVVFGVGDIEDEEALRNGNPTENDSFWAVNYLISKQGDFTYQQYGDVAAMINLNSNTEEITVFDTTFEGTNELTRSTSDLINGITDKGWIYGTASAPFIPREYILDDNNDDTDDETITYFASDFSSRGFYSLDKGNTIIPLMAPESTYGGLSAISEISETGIAIGFATTSITEEAQASISEAKNRVDNPIDCEDAEQLKRTPLLICISNVLAEDGLTLNNLYSTAAIKWTINDNGDVEEFEPLGFLITPHVDDERGLQSVAQAVNDDGTIVGYSEGWFDNDVMDPEVDEFKLTYAVMFKDGNVYDLNTDHETYYNSRANDINDVGTAVGYVQSIIGGVTTNSFYYIDTNNVSDLEMIMPDSFFTGSSTTAKAINNNGLIVGQGEVETHVVASGIPRRTHGFLYDTNTDTFTDLNTLLTCESDYIIIDAKSINDNNEISASALTKTNARDFFGNEVLDTKGDPIQEEVVRAVKLQPINGEIDNCSEVEEKIERQGASFGLFMPLVLLVVGFRRKLFK